MSWEIVGADDGKVNASPETDKLDDAIKISRIQIQMIFVTLIF